MDENININESADINNTSDNNFSQISENDPTKTNSKKHGWIQIFAFVVLFIGLIVLYILHFQNNKSSNPLQNSITGENSLMLTVNNDSIIKYFTLAELLTKDLQTEAEKYHQDLQSKQATLEEKYKNYQANLQKNILTQTQIQNAEKQLQQEAGSLQGLQEQYTQILAMKEMSVQKEITDSIINATQRVNKAKYNADYVLATSTGSAIIYANKVYDITDEVIKELNDTYKKSSN